MVKNKLNNGFATMITFQLEYIKLTKIYHMPFVFVFLHKKMLYLETTPTDHGHTTNPTSSVESAHRRRLLSPISGSPNVSFYHPLWKGDGFGGTNVDSFGTLNSKPPKKTGYEHDIYIILIWTLPPFFVNEHLNALPRSFRCVWILLQEEERCTQWQNCVSKMWTLYF